LEVLDISCNLIKTIAFLPNTLKELVCHNNNLKSVPSHDYILKLDCSHNALSSLNTYSAIKDIICHDNQIKTIPTYHHINRLICRDNPVIHIDNQPSVESLDCSTTNLSGKLSNMPTLKYFICNDTKIDDISNLINLETLEILNCPILKIPYLPKMKGLLYKNTQNIMLSSKYKVDMHVREHDNTYIKFA
jgi:Leucine-rich repeat (LRR) protein